MYQYIKYIIHGIHVIQNKFLEQILQILLDFNDWKYLTRLLELIIIFFPHIVRAIQRFHHQNSMKKDTLLCCRTQYKFFLKLPKPLETMDQISLQNLLKFSLSMHIVCLFCPTKQPVKSCTCTALI